MAKEQEVKLEAELKKLMQQRLDLEKQVVAQKAKMDSAEKKSIENIKKLISLEAVLMDSVEKEEEVRKKIEKIEKESEDRTKKREKSEKESLDRNKKQEQSEQTINKYKEERASLADKVRSFGDDELKNAIDISSQFSLLTEKAKAKASVLSETANINAVMAERYDSIAENIKDGYDYSNNFKSSITDTRNITDDITKLFAESIVQTGEIEKGTAKIVETDRSRQAIALKRAAIESGNLGLNDMEKSELLAMLALDEQRLNAIDEQNKVIEAQTAKVQSIQGIGSKLGDSMSGWVKKLPGGEQIYKLLGIDKTADKMNKSFTSAIQNGLQGNFKTAFAEGMKGFGSLIAMGPKLVAGVGLGALTGGFGLLAGGLKKVGSLLLEADGQIAQMGKDFAMSKKEAGELYKNTAKIANEMKITGINSKEIVEGINIASEAFQGVDVASAINAGNKEMEQFVKEASVLSKQFGLSGSEISNIKDIATITGTSMGKLVKESTELGKGTMNAKEAMKTLAGIPKEVAIGFKGSSKELVAAAQKAKMLGMDLKKVKDIGRGMLDLESSLTAEFEAQALTGKDMNLDTARRYAMDGDIFNLQEELLNKAGSLEEFTNMNVIQQEAMAKAMGMSVEEMTTMLTNAQKLSDAKIDANYAEKLSKMNAQELAAISKGTYDEKQKAYIEELAAQKRSASLQESFADAVEKLKQKFAPVIDAIIDMVGGLEEGGDKVSIFQEMLDSIDMDAIAAGVKEALPKVMEAVKGLIKSLPKIIEMVSGLISKFSGIAGAAGGFMDFLGPTTAGLGAMALKVAGPGGIASGFKLAAKGAGGLFDMVKGPLMDGVKGLAGSVGDKLGGAVGKVSDKFGALGDKMKGAAGKAAEKTKGAGGGKKAKMPGGGKKGGGMMDGLADMVNKMDPKKMLAGAAAILILAAALYVAAKALQEFAKVEWSAMGKAAVALIGLAAVAVLLGMASGPMLAGAAAVLVLGMALYVSASAFDIMGKINWGGFDGIITALASLAAGFVILGAAAPMIILGSAAMLVMGAAAAVFGAGLYVIAKSLAEFQKIGDFGKVGDNLAAGMEALGAVSDKVDLGKLEDSFEELNDALEELDFEQLSAFGQLGNSALKGAGDNLVAGINSLMGINQGINWGGLEDTFEGLEDALDELDLEGIQAFAKLGEEGIKNAGANLIAGLNSFQGIDPKAAVAALAPLESVFSALEDAFDELDYEVLDAFGKLDFSKMASNTGGLAQFAQSLGNIGSMSGIDKLEEQFENLSEAIDGLDIDKLNELSGIKPESMDNLGKLQAVFQPSQKIEAGGGAGEAGAGGAAGGSGVAGGGGAGGGSMSGVEAKLDQLIGLFSSIANQPTVIQFGDKVVEEIRNTINVKKSYQVEQNYGRRA